MLKLSKTQQQSIYLSLSIITGLLATQLVVKPAQAESKKPLVDLPTIIKTECRQEIDVEICRIYYKDGTWKEVTEPLGTMREQLENPKAKDGGIAK